MSDIITCDYLKNRQNYDFYIKKNRLLLHVFNIHLYLDRNRQFITTIDLSPPRQTRRQMMNLGLCSQFNQIMLIKKCWSWTDKTHITFENTPKLW
jgi:hypothetical protein